MPALLRFRLHTALKAFAIVAFVFCLVACFEIVVIPTASMERTVLIGDHLFVSKVLDAPPIPGTRWRLPRLGRPGRGQIVSFRSPEQEDVVFLKRVVAVAGDAIQMRGGVLYVNDLPETQPYAARCRFQADTSRQIVPAGYIFVMGDNRDNSEDSRTFGPVTLQSVVGRPLLVLWSLRTRSSDWFDVDGQPKNTFYWSALRHVVASTRWSRTGTLL